MKKTQTVAIIKPGFLHHLDLIKKIIVDSGFKILQGFPILLSKEYAKKFYEEHKGKPFFDELVDYMSSDSIYILLLEKKNAIEDFRTLIGSTDPKKARIGTIRNLLGQSIQENVIHGSDSVESAKREIDFFFGLYE